MARDDLAMGLGRAMGDFPHALVLDLLERAGRINPRAPKDEIARWFDTKPAFADWFTKCETTASLLALSTRQEITAFVVPRNCFGVLRFFANACANVADYTNVEFTLDVDGAPLTGFASIVGPIAPSIQAPIPMMDCLLGGSRVRVTAKNLSSSTIFNVTGFIRGWYWAAQATPTPKS